MICESCGAAFPDDAAVCPECGVSTSVFFMKSPLITVKQTVPDFVKKPGAEPGTKTEITSVPETDNVNENISSSSTGSESEMPVNNLSHVRSTEKSSGAVSYRKTNTATSIGFGLGIFTVVLSLFPYSYALFIQNVPFILFIPPFLGIILSIIGLFTKQGKNVPKAVTGIILSVVGSVILLVGYYFFFLPALERISEMFENVDVRSDLTM